MIINNCSIISKKQKRIILIVSIIIDLIALMLLVWSIIASILSNNESLLFTLAVDFLGTISLLDFITIITKRYSFAWKIIKYFNNHHNKVSLVSSIELNTEQKKFCDKVIGFKEKNSYIYLYGKKGKGKTTTILYLLSNLTSSNDISEIPWSNKLTFVDCTNQKEDILNFFGGSLSLSDRINKFNNSLVVIDNIEHMGDVFINENIELFSSSKSLFFLIEDTDNDNPFCFELLPESSLLIKNFNSSIIGIRQQLDIYNILSELDDIEKKIFFAICITTTSNTFANVKDLKIILNISTNKFKKGLKKILSKNVFRIFPFNDNYLYCPDVSKVLNSEHQFDSSLYDSVLIKFIISDIPTFECRWICLVKSKMATIFSIPSQERIKIFHNALSNGDYKKLYEELCKAISLTPEKINVFTYEKAFLSFYVGNHKDATELFWKLVNSQNTTIKRNELLLQIIQSNHGDPNQENMNSIFSFINLLKEVDDFYSVCAKYWEIHIDSEKGKFDFSAFHDIREKIKKYDDNKLLKKSVIQRSFTDEIRCYHILGINPPIELYLDYCNFLKNGNINRYTYFYNLYVEANDIHYIKILDSILNKSENIQELIYSADYYYNLSLSSSYNDEKSKSATKMKHLDLKMIYADFNFEEAVRGINLFRTRAQMNNVKVHEAYSETLLIKALFLNPQNISNDSGFVLPDETLTQINQLYHHAKQIYSNYKNEYGIMRLEFLLLLMDLLNNNAGNIMGRLNDFLKSMKGNYNKEQKVIKKLIEKNQENDISFMYLLSIFRGYPIILQ